jgi:hypothetical protein
MEPSILRLFPKPREHRSGRHCVLDDEVETSVELWFRHQGAQLYRDGLNEITLMFDDSVKIGEVIVWRSKCM